MERITSRTNPRIQRARFLRESKYRRETGRHFIEGDKLVREAMTSGAELETVFVREGYAGSTDFPCELLEVTDSVMDALSTAGTPQSLCAVAKTPIMALPETFTGTVLLLEDLQDPGNVGTLIRTADALGAGSVILSPRCADPFSPKTLRASMGSVYHLPVYVTDIPAALRALNDQGYTCLCGHLRGSEELPPKTKKMALLVGNEGNGVTDEAAALCCAYRLPMPGKAESLNAAVFGAIMLYELTRK
ncbi:MAG: RNA methyltransferase [Clostridia bacterium]|nr:RNA methyltransferase [Clostridia bacterium]